MYIFTTTNKTTTKNDTTNKPYELQFNKGNCNVYSEPINQLKTTTT